METIEDFLKLQRPRVKANTEIITPEILGQNFFLHIDIKTPKAFFPMVSKRGLYKEDNNVPRITVCDNLVNCIRGYSIIYKNFTEERVNKYTISKLNFEYALKPNTNLVPDADYTDEYWLVTYNKKTVKYIPEIVGTFFLKEVILTGKPTKSSLDNLAIGIMYLHIEDKIDIRLDNDKTVNEGYYLVKFNFNLDIIESYTAITKEEYNISEKNHSRISKESLKPLYSRW